jgi:hypothetical protein
VSIGAAVGVAVSLDHDMVYRRGLGEMQSVSEACFLIDAMQQVKSWEDERWQGCSSVIHTTASGMITVFLRHMLLRGLSRCCMRDLLATRRIPGEAHEARNITEW